MRVEALVSSEFFAKRWIRGRVTGGQRCIPGQPWVQVGIPGESRDYESRDEIREHLATMYSYEWTIHEFREIEE